MRLSGFILGKTYSDGLKVVDGLKFCGEVGKLEDWKLGLGDGEGSGSMTSRFVAFVVAQARTFEYLGMSLESRKVNI
jgi:hypothetical protein